MASKEEQFYDSLLIKHGFELITVANYKRVLKKFIKDIGTSKPKRQRAETYLAEMRKKDYPYSHISNSGVIISRYMEFIGRVIDWHRPRRPNTLPTREILTEGEIARILAATKNSREKAMISILAYCGLRNKELCQLKVKNIDLDNNLVKVIGGKLKKDRIVPMSKECGRTIIKYLRDYGREKKKRLFETLVLKRDYNGWALRKMVKVVARRAKIKKRVYPHLFRHSFISHLIDRGANIVAVQQFAGHSRIETTMLYTHLTPERIQKEYRFHIPSYL